MNLRPSQLGRTTCQMLLSCLCLCDVCPALQDAYANAFKPRWRSITDWPDREDRKKGKAGWVAERKYEIDSGAYYLSFLWNYWCTASTVGIPRAT